MDAFDLQLWPLFFASGGTKNGHAIIDQVCIDSRRISSKHSLFVALEGTLDGHDYVSHAAQNGAKFALVKKGWLPPKDLRGITLLTVNSPLRALQSLASIYRQQLNCKLIAITGTHGKTMVKDLLQLFLQDTLKVASSPESFNSQIGVALSLFTLEKHHEIALIEAAISLPNEMNTLAEMIKPDAVILTHLGKKHLTTLGSLEVCASEMIKLLEIPKETAWVLLPNAPLLSQHYSKISAPIYHWNQNIPNLPHAAVLRTELEREIPYQIIFPDGNHFNGSITSAYAYFLDLINISVKAAWLLKTPSEAIHKNLHDFSPEPMRTEIWESPTGVTFINDAYCSDPQSIDQALKFYDQASTTHRKVFVFGGMRSQLKETHYVYHRVGEALSKLNIQLLILVGNHPFKPLIDELRKNNQPLEIVQTDNYNTALTELQQRLNPGDVVLVKGDKKIPLDLLIDHFNDSLSSNQCIINLTAIKSNLAALKSKVANNVEIMVMVKAFAYGTDEVKIAKFLANCGIKHLGVSYTDEGVNLKRAGVAQEIFVINAAPYEAAKVAKWDLTVGVSNTTMIEALLKAATENKKYIKVHLHVDTGMGRFGCRPEEALALATFICGCPQLKLEGIMTHFSAADDPSEDLFTKLQIETFDSVITQLQSQGIHLQWKHAANSSAAVRFQLPQYNMIRIGLAAYGFYTSETVRQSLELTRALSLVSRIVCINICKAGESISYGRSYTVKKDVSRIAVLPIGYFDGLHRNYSGKGDVIIRGKKAPMVGHICMDFMMVDVTEIPEASIGDRALIFGYDEFGFYLSPEKLADQGDSIVHELITCLGPRIQRIFIHEEANIGFE
ncbi:MAG: bifunctional UDP-N-acetylmuramoyl-tripeptide:D-alanyl-D-alanine ligase/alanine racemase [Parachlamydiaceae bacterium]|nr:bifunctional UDP-N-acetylmuramoyl-tripeptide:D-alanyl-D-alanine ligase/alanine racemase [Parachlamydiaceae bacterium]